MMTIANILLVLWLLGLVTGTTLGGFIYVLLVVAAVLFPMRLMGGRGAAARGPQARSHDRWNAPVPLEGTGA